MQFKYPAVESMGEIILVVLVYSIGMYLAIEKTAGFNTTEESFTATLYTTSVHEKAFQMIAVAVRKLKQRRGLLNMHRQRCSVAQLLNVPYEPTGVVECTPLLLICFQTKQRDYVHPGAVSFRRFTVH